jgi:hypothetical protein
MVLYPLQNTTLGRASACERASNHPVWMMKTMMMMMMTTTKWMMLPMAEWEWMGHISHNS